MKDPVETNPELYRIVFENDRVRVLEYKDLPGDATTAHSHPDSVMITMSTFRRRLVHGEDSVEVELPAHQVRWLDAQEHAGENVGDTATHTFFIELKEPATATVAPLLGPQ